MSTSLNHAVFIQIKSLIQGLINKKVMRNVKNELLALVDSVGNEAEKYMFICLFESIDFKDPKTHSGARDQLKTQLLTQRLTVCSSHSTFLDYFSQVIEAVCLKQNMTEYMNDIIKCLKLGIPMQIIMSVSLALSHNPQVSKEGIGLLKQKLYEYYQGGKTLPFPDNALSVLLFMVRNNPEFDESSDEIRFLLDNTSISDKIFDFKPMLVKDFSSPYLSEDSIKIWDVLEDLGPSVSQSIQPMASILSDFPSLDEESVLQILLMMSNNQTCVEDSNARIVDQAYFAYKSHDQNEIIEDNTEKKLTLTWNVDNFLKVIGDTYPNMKWTNIVKKLDMPNLQFKDPKAFSFLFKVFQKFKKFPNFVFPASILFERWKHTTSQTNFLIHMINAGQPDLVFFHECNKRQVSLELYPNLRVSALTPPVLQFWCSLDLVEILVEYSESDYFIEIRNLFDLPLTKCPDMLILGLAQIKPKFGAPLLDELYSVLLPLYLSNHASSFEILEVIWRLNPGIMITAFAELYKRDNSSLNLSRVLDITQEIKDSLIPIVNSKDYYFSVSLGILAAKRDFLHLDQWISERIKTVGNPFIAAIFQYLDENIVEACKIVPESQFEAVLEKSQLTLESLLIIFQILMSPNLEGKINLKNRALLGEKYKEMCKLFPKIISEYKRTEIEEAANILCNKIYRQEMSIPELIDLMTRYKTSNVNKEREIFACIITNLFDEYRFFPKYPPKELLITAQIYGSLINNNLIEGVTRDIGLRGIFDAFSKPGKMFDFGLTALEFFKSRLHEWPAKTVSLFSSDVLREKHIELLEDIRMGCEAKGVKLEIPSEYFAWLNVRLLERNSRKGFDSSFQYEHSHSPQRINPNSQQILNPSSLKPAVNILPVHNPSAHGLLDPRIASFPSSFSPDPHMMASSNIKDKPFTNTSIEEISKNFEKMKINKTNLNPQNQTNSGGKTGKSSSGPDSAKSPKPENDLPVVVPASRYSNSLTLEGILASVDKELPEINEEVRNKIIFAINNFTPGNVEEKHNDIKQSFEDPVVITWLAKYIVYKRAPIEQNNHNVYVKLFNLINRKDVWQLVTKDTYVFIRMILESDKIFIPNPENKATYQVNDKAFLKHLGSWLGLLTLARSKPITMKDLDIKGLLLEAYDNNKLDYILPFVCKILSTAGQSTVFHPNNAWMRAILSLLSEIATRQETRITLKCEIEVLYQAFEIKNMPPSNILEKRATRRENRLSQGASGRQITPNTIDLTIHDLPIYVSIDMKILSQFMKDFDLKQIVAQAVDLAIKEIIPPVISRSVTIALITTRELALKDFALEPDEKRLHLATHLIVQNLAGNLALVTCREPLKLSLTQHLKTQLDKLPLDEKNKELIVNTTSGDNLDLGCALIKKAVIEKALDEVNQDQAIIDAIEKRKHAREKNEKYFDENIYKLTRNLPEVLRPGLNGLTNDQMKIYEEFGKFPKNQPPRERQNRSASRNNLDTDGTLDSGRSRDDRKLDNRSMSLVSKFDQLIFQFDEELTNLANSRVQDRQEKLKDVQNINKNIMDLIQSTENIEELAYDYAIRMLELIFMGKIQANKITFFLPILQEIRRYDDKLSTEIIGWILNPAEKRYFKPDIILKLIREGFISINDLDPQLAEVLDNPNNVTLYMSASKIIKTLVFEERILDVSHFSRSIEIIVKNAKLFKDIPEITKFLEDYRNHKLSHVSLNNQTKAKVQSNQDYSYKTTLTQALALFNEKDSQLYELTFQKFEEWLNVSGEADMFNFIKNLETNIFQAGDENLQKFFAYLTDICVDHALNSANRNTGAVKLNQHNCLDFSYIDAYSRLIIVILKTILITSKNDLLEKILQSVLLILTKNHDQYREKFNQRPFFRLLLNILYDVKRKEYGFSSQEINQFLLIFMKVFDKIQPLKYPGFAFAWLELISNKNFMPLILGNTTNKTEYWFNYCILILDLFRFFKETIDTEYYKTDYMKNYFKGTLRLLLVILHDFPEFLIEMSFTLCESLPEKFYQVRNLILSAFPKNMQPPDPFRVVHSNQIEAKDEFKTLPTILTNFEERIISIGLHTEIMTYLTSKNEHVFRNICTKLLINDNSEININYPVVNSFVLFIPWMIYRGNFDYQKITELKLESHDLLWKLLVSSNFEMREALLNAIMNQIRYPNPITFYFINLIFSIFSGQNDENLQEQIIRIFVERLIIERPHPWGIMYTFIELIRNKNFFRTKQFFKPAEFDEIFKHVFKYMTNTSNTNNSSQGGLENQESGN